MSAGHLKTFLVLLGVAALAVMASGCGSAGERRQLRLQAQAAVELTSGQTEDEATLANAQQEAVQRCMEQRGLRFYPLVLPASRFATLVTSEVGDYDLASRKVRGYGIADALATSAGGSGGSSLDDETRYERSMSRREGTRYTAALFGPTDRRRNFAVDGVTYEYGTRGCFAQADTAIYGSVAAYVSVFEGLPAITRSLATEVNSDAQFRSALQHWSSCMRRRGFHYSSPYGAQNSLVSAFQHDGVSRRLRAKEIRVAVDDELCGRQTRLPGALAASVERAAGALGPATERAALQAAALEAVAVKRVDRLFPGGA